MKQICGMNVRRTFRGPASMLASVVDENNQQHTAIVFHEQFHNHPALNDSLFIILDFLQAPFVTGLADLLVHEPENGAFVFGTGPGTSVAELIRTATDLNIKTGARTGLEFMYKVGHVLVEASHAAQTYTVFSHGGLTPWRIILKDSGDVSVIGYALPQVEMLDFQRDERMKPTEDSFRYCPPERIRSEPEDLSSDLFTLGLIAFELMTLMPMYDGTVDAIRQRAIRGDASQQIYAARDVIPIPVARLLERTLQSNRDARFHSGREFLDAIGRLLEDPNIPGLSLSELLKQVKQQANSEVAPLPSNDQDFRTALLSRENLLQNREMYTSQKALREQVVLGGAPGLNMSQNSTAKGVNSLYESQSVITTSGSSWKPVERQRNTASEPVEAQEPAEANATAPDRLQTGDRRSGASNILKMLRESQRSLSVEGLSVPTAPHPVPTADDLEHVAENDVRKETEPSVPSFVKNIKRKRQRQVAKPAPSIASQPPSEKKGAPDVIDVVMSSPEASPPRAPRRTHAQPELPLSSKDIKSVLSTSATDSTAVHPQQVVSKPEVLAPSKPSSEKNKPEVSEPVQKTSTAQPIEADVPSEHQAASQPEVTSPAQPVLPSAPTTRLEGGGAQNDILNAPRFTFASLSVNPNEARRYAVQRNEGSESIVFKATANNTTAEFVSGLLTNRLIATRVSLSGRILGWYRFQQGEQIFKGPESMAKVNAKQAIQLYCVPNDLVWVQIELDASEPIRYRAQIAQAIPMVSLIDHFVAVYGLKSSGWVLEVNGQRAGLHDILWDYISDGQSELPALRLLST